MQQEYFYRIRLQPSTDRRLSPRQKYRMWVVHGCAPHRGSRPWLHPLFGDCLRAYLSTLQRLTRLNVLMVITKPRHLTSMMVAIMFSSLAWAEPMTIVPVGPRTDTTNDLSLRHAQPGLMIDLPLEKPSQLTWARDLLFSATTNSQAGTLGAGPNRRHCRRRF
jgi:hypothetical protein